MALAEATAPPATSPTAPGPAPTAGQSSATSPLITEVIVTARRREENIQRVPETVTAVSAAELREQNITTSYDLMATAPSLTVETEFNTLFAQYAIRGLTTGVTTYFSEAPCCTAPIGPFLDISSVQVLNGPQGTLFGRSSAAGAILITPEHPNLDSYGGLIDLTGGTYNRAQATGVINLPIIPDHLAVRLAVQEYHVEGYTDVIGTNQKLDGIDNQQVRLGIEFKNGGFDNYLVGSYLHVDQPDSSGVLAVANLNYGLYNLDVPVLQGIRAAFAAELARQAAGGSIRLTPASYNNTPEFQKENQESLVDIAQYDFPRMGALHLSIKDVFSIDALTDDTAGWADGIGGRAEISGAFTTGPLNGYLGSNNQLGTAVVATLSPPIITYTNDLQIHADIGQNLLNSTLGLFYSNEQIPVDLAGTSNIYQLFSGFLANGGYNSAGGFSDGGHITELALYTQETLDVSRWIHGLSVTGGFRWSWDHTLFNQFAADQNSTTGAFNPGAVSTSGTDSSGYNFTASVSEQITPTLMVYGTVARAYVPGGINTYAQSGADLPNYTPTYAPETVLDEELGAKWSFAIGSARGLLSADVYRDTFSDIAESFTGQVGNASIIYFENIAGATLRGFEFQGTFIPIPAIEFRASYNYNNAFYTHWIGQDPFNVAKPGDPGCLSSSPSGYCLLNLANNPFPLMPTQQAHLTVIYRLPTPADLGRMSLSATAYAQGREYYEPDAARDLQLFPAGLPGVSQAPYATLNLRYDWADIRHSGVNIGVFATNLTNTIYATGKTPQIETLGFSIVNYAPPRMIGVEIWKRFGP